MAQVHLEVTGEHPFPDGLPTEELLRALISLAMTGIRLTDLRVEVEVEDGEQLVTVVWP